MDERKKIIKRIRENEKWRKNGMHGERSDLR